MYWGIVTFGPTPLTAPVTTATRGVLSRALTWALRVFGKGAPAAAGPAEQAALRAVAAAVEQIAQGKSMNVAIEALNRAAASQTQAVKALTQVVANAGKHLVPATIQGAPSGTMGLSGVVGVKGALTPVISIAPNGVATMGSGVAAEVSPHMITIVDFVPK